MVTPPADGSTRRPCSARARVTALVLAAGLLASLTVAGQQNLPNLGEPSDNALSPLEERELGAEFMRQIRRSLPLVNDAQLEEFMQTLGTRLALASGKSDARDYRFFIVDEPSINAFAIPGGYVGVNAGLVEAMAHEEQLASVLAHEVAHITQRHHARSFATGTRNSLSAAASLLAAILIGSKSPEAGQAALAAGLAATQQSAINFTRANEIEADRIGIEILGNARYDPSAMAESFAILRNRNSLNTSADQIEYLRTHPLDSNRVAEARDRAAGKVSRPLVDQVDYRLFKGRLAVLTTEDAGQLQNTWQAEYERSPDAGNAYILALLNIQANRLEKARVYLDTLQRIASGRLMVEMLEAEWLEADGQIEASREALLVLDDLFENQYSIIERLVGLDTRAQRHAAARDRINEYLRGSEAPDPLAWRQLASIEETLNEPAASHEALARYFAVLGEPARAMSQLELALREVPTGSQAELRLSASLKSLQRQQLENER